MTPCIIEGSKNSRKTVFEGVSLYYRENGQRPVFQEGIALY